jgi:hypothetical protein
VPDCAAAIPDDHGAAEGGAMMDYASRRCPKCFWALYDGHIGQNPDCYCYGKRLRKVVRMTNDEAAKKIKERCEKP